MFFISVTKSAIAISSSVAPVPVATHVTIEPHTSYSWLLTHGPYEMKKYPLAVGRHTVVGKVIGYGQSEPDEFEVRSSF